MSNPNVRRPKESQKKYRVRRTLENLALRVRVKYGRRVLWNSSAQGTYVRAKHGELR